MHGVGYNPYGVGWAPQGLFVTNSSFFLVDAIVMLIHGVTASSSSCDAYAQLGKEDLRYIIILAQESWASTHNTVSNQTNSVSRRAFVLTPAKKVAFVLLLNNNRQLQSLGSELLLVESAVV
jgi:hypothetical protein